MEKKDQWQQLVGMHYQRLSIDSTDENKIINEIIMHCLILKKMKFLNASSGF